MDLLQDDPKSVLSQMTQVEKSVTELLSHDNTNAEVAELINSARIQLEEAVDTLRQYSHGIEPQPQRLNELDSILSNAHQLAKKHQVDTSELTAFAQKLTDEFSELESMDESVESLNKDLEKILSLIHISEPTRPY